MAAAIYGATKAQNGANEDAFLIEPGKLAVVADGAGAAQQAAKRVVTLFKKLVDENPDQLRDFASWHRWIKLLDSSLLGQNQSTFVGVAVLDSIAIGAVVGDSRIYLLDRDGNLRLLADGSKHRLGSGRADAVLIQQPVRSGDTLLLMSDGAWTPLGSYRLTQTVLKASMRDVSEVPQAIIDAANGSGDDRTAVVVRVRH